GGGGGVYNFVTVLGWGGLGGGPLSSALLKLDGMHGLSGWQWLFLFEGVPTVLVGISVLFVLKDGPEVAGWLKPEERTWLKSELRKDQERYGAVEHHHLLDAFRLSAVWLLAGVYITIQIGVYIVNLWMPLILSGVARGDANEGSLIARYSTVPYLLAALFS